MKSRPFVQLDVRPILRKGQDPYDAIHSKVASLKSQEGLELLTPFLPVPLIEMLTGQGFHHRIEKAEDGTWTTWFWREDTISAKLP